MLTNSILVPFFQKMPPKALHKVAQGDTPSVVNVPNNWAGIITWMAGRFGGAAVVATALAWGLVSIYGDQQKYNERMIQVFEKQATSTSEQNSALYQVKMALEALTQEARLAHRRTVP